MDVIARILVTALLLGSATAHGQSQDDEISPDLTEAKPAQQLADPPCASRCLPGLISLVTPLDRKPIDTFESHGGIAMDTIVRFGIENRIPLRIILPDYHLCSAKIELTARNQVLADVVDALVRQVEGYKWRTKDGVLAIEPRSISSSSAKLLTTQIPQFHFEPGTTQDLERVLWMFTSEVANPQKGYNLSHIDSVDAPKISVSEMNNATVEEILDQVVKQDAGGAWILLPTSGDFKKSLARLFVKIISYSDQHAKQYGTCNSVFGLKP